MGFLEALRQAVTGNPGGRTRSGAERLNLKVIRLFEEGRFREATEAARQLLEVQRQELGEKHPDYATSLSNLALLLQRQGDLQAAEPLLRQVLAVRKEVLGESHPDSATTLNNLGELLSLRGDLQGAEMLLRQALAVRKDLLGESHPDYAISLSSLALLLNKRGDSAGAEALLRQALAVRREMLGEFDPDYATGLSNLALLLFGRGELAHAEAMLRQALDIRRAALGEHHPDYIATSNSLARLLRRRAEVPRSDRTTPGTKSPGEDTGGPAVPAQETTPVRPTDPPPPRGQSPHDSGPTSAAAHVEGVLPTREVDQIAEDAALLTEMFKEAGERLGEAGRRMGTDGVFPDADVFRALAVCHVRLSTLRAEVQGLAKTLGIPCPPADMGDGLQGIDSLLETVAHAVAEGSRARALDVLDRVLRLRTRDQGEADLSALQECQDKARELHGIITASAAFALPPVVDQLASGEHPFACLLAVVDRSESLPHDRWVAFRRTVAWAYGPDLARSVAEARLFLPPETPAPAPAGPSPSGLKSEEPRDHAEIDG